MTEEEEKDNAFCEDCQRCYEDEFEELLTDIKLKENRIAELEKENAMLESQIEGEKEYSTSLNIQKLGLEKEKAKLKAHLLQWHNLRRNPEDLPNNYTYKICLVHGIYITARYNVLFGTWDTPGKKEYSKNAVIAWHEMPKFEE